MNMEISLENTDCESNNINEDVGNIEGTDWTDTSYSEVAGKGASMNHDGGIYQVKGRQINNLDINKENVEMEHNNLENTSCKSDSINEDVSNIDGNSSDSEIIGKGFSDHNEKISFDKTLKIILRRFDIGLKKKTKSLGCVKIYIKRESKEASKAHGKQNVIYYPQKHKSNESVLFKCEFCSYKSKFQASYEEHIENHKNSVIPVEKDSQGKRLYKCKDCAYETYVRSHLERHYRRHKKRDEAARYKCGQCNYNTYELNQFKNHQIRIHSRDMFYCFNCDYRTSNKNLLIQHMVIHFAKYNDSDNVYECPKCCFRTILKNNFQRHYISMHGYNRELIEFKCSECDHRSKSKNDSKYHMECHKKSSTLLKCPICSFETYDKYNFSKHRKTHKPTLNCDQCVYQTTNLSLLKCHIRNCHNATLLHCYSCSFNTPIKYRLIQHMKIHRQIEKRTYKCKYCNYETKDGLFIRRHVSNHEGADKSGIHHCNRCDFTSKYKTILIRHLKAHERRDSKPFQCSLCSIAPKSKGKLALHMLSHKTKEEVVLHKCRICKYASKYYQNLNYHLKTQHSESR